MTCKKWCAREDLNLQSFRNQILSLARLPFRHARIVYYQRLDANKKWTLGIVPLLVPLSNRAEPSQARWPRPPICQPAVVIGRQVTRRLGTQASGHRGWVGGRPAALCGSPSRARWAESLTRFVPIEFGPHYKQGVVAIKRPSRRLRRFPSGSSSGSAEHLHPKLRRITA